MTFLTLALLLAGPAAAHAATMLYPNMRTLPPRELRFDRTDVSADSSGDLHNVLRFSNTVYNTGEGPAEIRATINKSLSPPSGQAYQRVYDDQGGHVDILLPGSTLYYHAVHVHYHFDHWGGYELWTKPEYDAWLASGKTAGSPDLVGQKTTSCVEDEEFVVSLDVSVFPAAYPPSRCMPDSNNVIAEGLSTGWGDTYDYYRFEQWIDLGQSTLPDGTYVLRSVADPLNLVYESPNKSDSSREGSADNAAITTFVVSGGKLVDSDPPSGTVTINHVDRSTSTGAVSLDILGRDDVSGVRAFRVSNDGTTWKSYANTSSGSIPQTISWDLTDPSTGGSNATGTRTVYVLFQDNSGKWSSAPVTDTISYDPPAAPPPPTSAYGQAVSADQPTGWWRLGDASGTTAVDQMGLNNGAYSGGVTLGQPSLLPADANKAVAFNGSSGYARIPAAVAFNFTSAFSLEAWIKPTSLPTTGAFRSVLTKPESYSLQFNGARLEFTVIQSGTRRRLQTPSGLIVAGGTYHVVGTYDGSTQRLYVNGALVASAALTGPATVTTNPIAIGSWNGSMEYFAGTIDEPAVYGKVLSASQVRAHYDAAAAATLAAPSNLTAIARSPSQVDLGWLDNSSGETGQVLERSTSSSFSSPTDVALGANQQSYSDTGLAAGTTYWYRIKSVSGGSSSAWSSAVQVTTPANASYAATVIVDRPVSYWRLGETSGTIAGDETVANPGTYENATLGASSLVATDPANAAVGFDGASSDVRVGQSGSLDLSGAITLEAFVKPTSLPAAGSLRSIVAKTGSYALELNGPTVELTLWQLGVARRLQAPAGTILAGRAYHVVGTFDGATERLYVNGRQVASAALSGVADTTVNGLRIGSWDGTQQFFAGTIDEAAVYGKALTATQVAAHFAASQQPLGAPTDLRATSVSASQIDLSWADNAGAETGQVLQRSTDSSFSAPTSISLGANVTSYSDTGRAASTQYWYRVRAVDASSGSAWSPVASATTQAAPAPASYASVVSADRPVGWWRLGETSGTTAVNQTGGSAGTYAGGYALNQPSLLATDMVDRGVGFDGSSARVSVPSSTALQLTSKVSLEAWIKPTSLPVAGAFRSVLTKAESYSLQFNGPRMEFTIIQSGTRRRLQAPSGAIAAGGTYHVVGTFDGATQRLYVNGAQVASAALSGSASTNTRTLFVGSWDGASEFFAGTIDEPAVYGSVLSASQVAAHYRAGTTG